jgi:hypothetical protein
MGGMKEKFDKELKELESIDVIFINKPLTIFENVPSYALFFFILPIVGILSFNLYFFAGSLLLFVFLLKISIYFTKKNITFLNFFSAIGYVFKPKYIIIKNKEYFKRRVNVKEN